MQGPKIKIAGRNLTFASNGDVMETTSAGTAKAGAWRSESTEADNHIRYDLGGVPQPPISAAYSFNANNQLVLTLTGDAGKSSKAALQGRIAIGRDHNLSYFVVADDGSDTGTRITVYAKDFQVAEKTNNLRLTLVGRGVAEITGESGIQSLEAEKNHLPSFRGDDLLTYQAVTRNPVGTEVVAIPAELDFVGSWDLEGDRLVFISEVKTGPRPSVAIGFAGRVKGVTTGFAYFADGKSTDIALHIRGQHTFKSTTGVTDLTWETSLGFSGKTFRAAVDVDVTRTTAKGRILNLNGKLRLEKKAGKAPEFDFEMRAIYDFGANNMLVFRANIETGSQPAYDLMLEGSFVYSNLQLSFLIHYTNRKGAPALRAEVGLQGRKEDMISMLRLVLDLSSDGEARMALNLSFEVRMRFANGVRIKDKPKEIAASAIGGV